MQIKTFEIYINTEKYEAYCWDFEEKLNEDLCYFSWYEQSKNYIDYKEINNIIIVPIDEKYKMQNGELINKNIIKVIYQKINDKKIRKIKILVENNWKNWEKMNESN